MVVLPVAGGCDPGKFGLEPAQLCNPILQVRQLPLGDFVRPVQIGALGAFQ